MNQQFTGTIALPDGTLVRGRGRREPFPSGLLPDFGLYLGHPPDAPRRGLSRLFPRRVPWQPDWPANWILWPDFRTPRDSEDAAAKIAAAYRLARSGQHVEIACTGGTGRTGTVIACLAVLAGHPVDDAITWTRNHYRPRAVETPGQRRWIAWFAHHHTGWRRP
ncbi:phosphatase [Micromonospora sp. KC721]|uniref:phosphatase domain-containing protein n=1 Tax=Micromonospora sp. KC721 TaxID=2530380 RepID=UPI00104ADF09|nr:phosphatase [Micromonospora sp. KC721]TDB74826.1 phosphatase [Micromonospora sp. KC721]